jgi:DNA primase
MPSLVRLAIALLLHYPSLARDVTDAEQIRALERPGIELLVELILLLKQRDLANAGAIIEHFRDSEHQPHLAKLLVWQHPVLEQTASDCMREFNSLILRLRREAIRQEIERLNSKQQLSGSNDQEKAELLRLFKQLKESEDAVLRS